MPDEFTEELLMNDERYCLFLFWASLFMVMVPFVWMVAFVIVLPALANESSALDLHQCAFIQMLCLTNCSW